MRPCFGMQNFGISPVFEYLDYVTDIPGFTPELAKASEGGYMRGGVLQSLRRYVRDNPGTKSSGKTEEQMLDDWIKARSTRA